LLQLLLCFWVFNQLGLHAGIFFVKMLLKVSFVIEVYVHTFDVLHKVRLFVALYD
jgi:hypothetical protein